VASRFPFPLFFRAMLSVLTLFSVPASVAVEPLDRLGATSRVEWPLGESTLLPECFSLRG
jgi:hypothetical protein